MRMLMYHGLAPDAMPGFDKVRSALEAGDFRAAQVKKIGDNLYRARLDRRDRLLFSLHRRDGETFILALEHIANHDYDKSRFLRRGATVDEDKLPDVEQVEGDAAEAAEDLVYVHPEAATFHILDKVISFDDAQREAYAAAPPLIIIGSAGSGKTALTLEKMKLALGQVLYVTRSPYLVRSSRDQYFALGYENDDQEVNFLSFMEYLESWQVPEGREVVFRDFSRWFSRHRVASGFRDPHPLFEEFQGVLTGSPGDEAFLSLEGYLRLGVRQSIYPVEERERVYDLFTKYRAFLESDGLLDTNMLSFAYREQIEPIYDFVVIDEVQDFTTVQLDAVLRSLKEAGQFVLCGDANQIVHPNFFSWSKVKSFFHEGGGGAVGPIRILDANYRNAEQVTELANRVLKLKTARFGSVDRESNVLVRSGGDRKGAVVLLDDTDQVTEELNRKTRRSTRVAIIVLDEQHKAAVRQRFETPLVFTVQEAKGLEYESIVLYDFASSDAKRFREIVQGVDREDVWADELRYARTRDKSDKSLEIFKFHVNALYVAITRAVANVYLVESDPRHPLFDLLGLKLAEGPLEMAEQDSTLETWRQEARRLELQGKDEQAEQIRSQILQEREVPWEVLQGNALAALKERALERGEKKSKLLLFEYAQVVRDTRTLNALAREGFKPAMQAQVDTKQLNQKYYFPYSVRKPDLLLREVEQYGVDFRNVFNETPLMIAARMGNADHVERLVDMGADPSLVDNAGLNAFQIALEQACIDPAFASGKLEGMVDLLAPPELVLRVDGKLVKLDRRSMEYLLVNLMFAMFYPVVGEMMPRDHGAITSGALLDVLETLPDSLVAPRRKRRPYVSSVLAKNEMEREDRYNRRLFLRVKHGHYVLSPMVAVRVGGAWCPVYDLVSVDALALRTYGPDGPLERFRAARADENLRNFRVQLAVFGYMRYGPKDVVRDAMRSDEGVQGELDFSGD